MTTKTKENNMTSLKTDLLAALTIGVIAGLLSPIVAKSNHINISAVILFVVFVVLCVTGIVVARFAGKYIPVVYKLGKFGETGGLNWLVDLGVVNLLILVTGISTGLYFTLFKAVSFTVAVTNSYFWNKFWVFKGAAKQDEKTEVGKFITASLVGLAFNVTLASAIAFIGFRAMPSLTTVTWANLGVVFGSLGAMLFNFVLYKAWVFKDK
jgi:putative flippase GtrA